jgi:hypothetical protein
MSSDPIVAEICAVRERIAAECDYDYHKMCRRGEDILRQWQGKVVTKQEFRHKRVGSPSSNKS